MNHDEEGAKLAYKALFRNDNSIIPLDGNLSHSFRSITKLDKREMRET